MIDKNFASLYTLSVMEISSQSAASLPHLAINAALESRWEDAISINQEIIKNDPKNIDALTRLARAYFELGDLPEAKKLYTEALEYDPYNPIAQKNLKIIESYKKITKIKKTLYPNGSKDYPQERISPSLFLQEPGKTKIVNLLKVAEPRQLTILYPGIPVELTTKNRKLIVTDRAGIYLGVLPDDISHRLIRLIDGGNKYLSLVKSVRPNALTILIKESFRSKKFKNQPSFPEQYTSSSNTTIISSLTNDPISSDSDADESNDQEEA